MDSRAAERLIRSLSFDVEAIPQKDNALKAPTNQAPMNLKIRVRKKEGMVLQKNTVLTIPNMSHPERAPERVRLAGSDTTIMSFDVLMETDSEKRPAKKHRRIFGGCFGTTSDDEEAPYNVSSAKKDIKSDTDMTLRKGNGKEKELAVSSGSKNTTFFGTCKPGGCLDPPFGEDRYKYQPKLATNASVSAKDLKISSSKDKINNTIDKPFQDIFITTPGRGRIRSKSDSTEKYSENIKYKIHSRQTSKSSLVDAQIIETITGSRTIIVKELRKSNNDLDTALGSGRSGRDHSPEMYRQTKRDSRYRVLEPIIKTSRSNSVEPELIQQNNISKHTIKRNSRDNSPKRNKEMNEKSQHPQQIPDSRMNTIVQETILGNKDTPTTDIRKVIKRDSKDHSQETRGLIHINSHNLDKQYERSNRDHISKIERGRQISISSRDGSPEQNRLTQNCVLESDDKYNRGSRDHIPDIKRDMKQISSSESNRLTQIQPDKHYRRHSRDSILEIDTRLKIVSREHSLEPNRQIQVNTLEPEKHYQRDSKDHIPEMDRQPKLSSRERSPETDTAMKIFNINHIPVFKGKQEKEYMKTVESERSEKTKADLTNRKNKKTTMSSNALATLGVDELDNMASHARKVRDSYATIQKKPNKKCSKEISGDISNVILDDTDSIITYPPAMTSSELQFVEKKIEKRNTSKINSIPNSISSSRARSSVNEFTNKYFSPPKKGKARDSYASILNPPQDNVFIGTGDKEIKHEKKDTISEIPPKETNSLESMHVQTREQSHVGETSDILFKSSYPVSKDTDIRDDINMPMPQGRYSIDTLIRKQEINTNSHYTKPIQIRSDPDDETLNNQYISSSEMYETDVVDDTQQNAPVFLSPDEMDRLRANDKLSENGANHQHSQNLARISKSNALTNNIADGTNGTEIHEGVIAQESADSTVYYTLNNMETTEPSPIKYDENFHTETTFKDSRSYLDDASARYSSTGGNDDAISKYDKLASKYQDNNIEDTPRNNDLHDEEEKSINVNEDKMNGSYSQVDTFQYDKSNNYSRFQDEVIGKESDNQSYRPSFKEDSYYVPASDVENDSSHFTEADYYALGTDKLNKSRRLNEDDHYVSATIPETKSPSDYQNSVDINSFRTLDDAVKADTSNETRSKSYHSGDSRLPLNEDSQLQAEKIRENTDDDEGIKSQDWQDFTNTIRAATSPRNYMVDSENIGSDLYKENKVNESKRGTPPLEYHDGNGKQVDTIFLELAIQTQLKNEDAISNTTRVIKSVLNAQNNKLRISIDNQNELSIQYKKLRPGSIASSQKIQFLLPRTQPQSQQESDFIGSLYANNMKDDRKGDAKGTPLCPLLSLEKFGSDLRETLSFVYENQLVPLQNTIKSLKEDIDFLASQQLLFRDRIHGTSSSRRIRPVRLIHSSKRCVCIGNPRY